MKVELVKAALDDASLATAGITGTGISTDTAVGRTTSSSIGDALEKLLEHDQLTRERMLGRAFSNFQEGKINFLPTFKYDKVNDISCTFTYPESNLTYLARTLLSID